ncbi:MAG: TraR/DksA family transcriptional regulator [Opitutales bacterium]|nr:TraR/DksA family transcriptional regulator [Opitutales bacterium]
MATAKKSKAKPAAKKTAAKNVAAKKAAAKKQPAKKAAQPKKAAKKPQAPAKKKPAASSHAAPKKIQKKPAPKSGAKKAVSAKKAPAKISKKPAAKPAAKKPAAKKPAQKKSSAAKLAPKKPAKPAAKKPASKKPAPKAVAPKPAAKPAVKKSAKPAAKAPAKPAAKKPAPKKPEPQKPAKAPAKKTAEKPEAKKAPAKKSEASKKSADQKHTLSVAEAIAEILKNKKPKKAEPAKELEKPAEPPAARQRACAGIYFSMSDLESYLATRDAVKFDENSEVSPGSSSKKKASKSASAHVAQVPKRALAAASISDILGFNPIEQSRKNFEEKDVPSKWKKYYKLLVDMKNRIQSGSSDKVESVSSSNMQLSHENSTQGMDAADIGSKNFERDMAFNLLSNEQTIISEVNAAIERIRNGTYGVCEITGKPIPESRLLAVPFTRCTIEGQKQKEAEMRRIKAGQRKQQFGVDLDSDNPDAELSDDVSE